MSTKPETTFIASVHKHLPRDLYRMKTHNPYLGGIPDIFYSGTKTDLWVEYKFIPKITPAQCRSPNLSALQLDWINGRHEEGRNVAVIVGSPTGGVLMLDCEWQSFFDVDQFKGRVKTRAELAEWIANFTMV